MEKHSTNRARTADELRSLGAHEDFIAAYFTEYEGRHSIVDELDPNSAGIGDTFIDNPNKEWDASIGGGYFNALWKDGASAAWRRADGNNRAILEKAGLAQTA